MEPLRFNSLVEAKEFTNGADKEDIGIPKYGKTFSAVIATLSTEPGRHGVRRRAGQSGLRCGGAVCKDLKALDPSYNERVELPRERWAEFVNQKNLERLNLSHCKKISGDVAG